MPAFSNHEIVIKLMDLEINKDLYIRSYKNTAEFLELIPQVIKYFCTNSIS
jgi:hypothetical protein